MATKVLRSARRDGGGLDEAEGRACLADGALGVVAGVVFVLACLFEMGDKSPGRGSATELVLHVGPVPVGLGEFAPGGVLLAADRRCLLRRRQVGEPFRSDRAAVVRGLDDRSVVALGLRVAEAREPHDAGHVCNRRIAAAAAGESLHGVLGGVRGPGARGGAPDNLVVLAGRADDGCRSGKLAGVHVREYLPEGVRAVLVRVELKAADLKHVRFLVGLGFQTHGVHGHEDVVPRRIEMTEEPLEAGTRGRARRHDALLYLRVRPVPSNCDDGQHGEGRAQHPVRPVSTAPNGLR